MKIIIFLILITLIVSSGCKKDKTPSVETCTDIEIPGNYFPGYPNTWWKYVNQNNDTILYRMSTSYESCHGICRPVFINLNRCLSKTGFIQDFYAGLGTSSSTISPIYSLTLDSIMSCPISFATFKEQTMFISKNDVGYKRTTTNLDTSFNLNGTNYVNVIEVYEYNINNPDHRYFDYFAKNIGLIKRDSLNVNDTTNHIQILRIEDYFIGN